jgi:hypothetical protein
VRRLAGSPASSVGIVMATGLMAAVRLLARHFFSLPHSVQTGSGVNLASYPMSIKGCFPGGKAAKA